MCPAFPKNSVKQNQRNRFLIASAIVLFLILAYYSNSNSATIEIYPSNADVSCNEEFENKANALRSGDGLVLHGGTYSQSCRRAITANGTASNPITISAATGETPILTRPSSPNFDYPQNNIEIENSSYLIIRGIKFKGGDGGVRFKGTNHHITFEDNEICETGNNAIALNSGNSDSMTIRRNHIHHTGLYNLGSTEGEGMYVGCNNNSCRVTNSLIEGNYIHHLRGTSDGGNDGIEIKVGSYGNIIRNNVIHDTNIGRQYPCIFVYGGGSAVNIVEGNVMWNCGEAIQVVSDAIIRNNIILNSSITGITAATHSQVAQMRNVTIVNNTIYGHPECLYIRWSGATNMTLANNAIYCPGKTAINGFGLTGSSIDLHSNYIEGSMTRESIDNVMFFAGGSAASAFVNPSGLDFWPTIGSILRNNANAAYIPLNDFNETPRTSPYDVGAYETEGLSTNPGWKIAPGFKQTSGSDAIPLLPPRNLRIE